MARIEIHRNAVKSFIYYDLTDNSINLCIGTHDDMIDVFRFAYAEMKKRNCFRGLSE